MLTITKISPITQIRQKVVLSHQIGWIWSPFVTLSASCSQLNKTVIIRWINYSREIWILSIGINLLIGLAYFIPTLTLSENYDFSYIPKLNATLNGLTFLSLIGALIVIMNKIKTLNIPFHKSTSVRLPLLSRARENGKKVQLCALRIKLNRML